MRIWKNLFLLAILATFLVLPAQARQTAPTAAELVQDFADDAEPEFTILLAAVTAADPAVLALLSDPEAEITVFAPTDEAFEKLFADLNITAEEALANPDTVTNLLLYHVVEGAQDAASLQAAAGTYIPSLLDGDALSITVEGENLKVDLSTVVISDVEVANGLIHVIDAPLIPDGISASEDMVMNVTIAELVADFADDPAPEFTILLTALQAVDPSVLELLGNPDSNLTVFAPTDAAFEAFFTQVGIDAEALVSQPELLSAILSYHLMDGYALLADIRGFEDFPTLLENNRVTVTIDENDEVLLNDTVRIIVPDVQLSNGVVHVIDAVLLPPEMLEESDPQASNTLTIADEVVAAATAEDAEFTILLAALQAVDPAYLELLNQPNASLTVFAPTDAAFEALFAELGISAEDALKETDTLANLLAYHLMDGYALLEDLKGFEDFPTLLPDSGVTVSVNDAGEVVLNGSATIVVPDVIVRNGVIHVIDEVLVPPSN